MNENEAGSSTKQRIMAIADIFRMIGIEMMFFHEANSRVQEFFNFVATVDDNVGNLPGVVGCRCIGRQRENFV